MTSGRLATPLPAADAAFTEQELLARPDAAATFARLSGSGDSQQAQLVGVLVLRARAAAERADEARQ